MKCNKLLKEALELKAILETKDFSKFSNIFSEGSYIKPSEFRKYKPKVSDEKDLGILLARQVKPAQSGDFETHESLLNFYKDYRKYLDGELSEQQIRNKYRTDGQHLQDFATDYADGVSGSDINKAHYKLSVIIDKPLYVTKSYIHDTPGLVSTFAVDPKNIKSFGDIKDTVLYKLDPGTRVTFVDRGKEAYEGKYGSHEEVVLDNNYLINSNNKITASEYEDLLNKLKDILGPDNKIFTTLTILGLIEMIKSAKNEGEL